MVKFDIGELCTVLGLLLRSNIAGYIDPGLAKTWSDLTKVNCRCPSISLISVLNR